MMPLRHLAAIRLSSPCLSLKAGGLSQDYR
jgi:hypothetical protein